MSLEKVGGAKSSGAVLLIGESYTNQHQIINTHHANLRSVRLLHDEVRSESGVTLERATPAIETAECPHHAKTIAGTKPRKVPLQC